MQVIPKLELCLLLVFCYTVNSAKILGIFFIPSFSHQIVYRQIYKELSLRGHAVTAITANPLKDPALTNLTEIDVNHLYKFTPQVQKEMVVETPSTNFLRMIFDYQNYITEELLKDERVRNIFKHDKNKFDLVMVETFTVAAPAFAGLFNAPLVVIASADPYMALHRMMGNPNHPLLYGDMTLTYHKELTLLEKLYFSYYMVYDYILYNYINVPKIEGILKKYLGDIMPHSLKDLERNISLLLTNTDPIINPIRPLVPTTVPIGFSHVEPVKELPKDLQAVLDESPQGVVYFSLGNIIKSGNLPKSIKNAVIQTFAHLPYKVLWKFENDDVEDLSDNVHIRKWFPQQDILAHPNIRAFVTQGGLQSLEEAIMRAVPVVGIPFFCDQPANVKKIAVLGAGIEIDFKTITKEKLTNAIIEVAENKRYKEKMLELQKIALDQPMTGVQRAAWWCEYVLRHNGTSHLKNPSANNISMLEYFLIHVLLFIIVLFTILVLIILIFFKVLKKCGNKIKND